MTRQNKYWPFFKQKKSEKMNFFQKVSNDKGKQSKNSHIEKYLDYYCHLEGTPGFSVLLKGKWGSGKTWFVKKYCKRLETEKKKHIYISLYGISHLSDIDDKFFQVLHPLLSSKPAVVTGILLKGLLKGSLRLDLDRDGGNDGSWSFQVPDIKLPKHLKDVDQRVIVFDDLERCYINLEDLFGYINSFVEDQGSKVIILANEEELIAKTQEYKRIKEKLIGKTFNIQFDLSGALVSFISTLNSEGAKQCLLENIELIQELYTKAEYENLRSLKQIVLDFERIFQELPEEAKDKSDLITTLLTCLIAFSIEIKKGSLNPQDIEKISNVYAKSVVNRGRKIREGNQEESTIDRDDQLQPPFLEKYNMFYSKALLPNESWWQKFFDKGILDIDELETSTRSSVYFQNDHMPNWKRLWHFTDLSDEDFFQLLPQVESEYFKREFSDARVIKHVFGVLLNLSHIGLYSRSPKHILEEAKEYVEGVLNKLPSYPLVELSLNILESSFMGAFGLAFQGKDSKEFEEFEGYVRELREIEKEKWMPRVAEELLDAMMTDVWKFKGMLCLGDSYNRFKSYHDDPLLNYVDKYIFFSNVLSMQNRDRQLIFYALTERHKFENHDLSEELEWLVSLQKALLSEAHTRRGTPTGYNLEFLDSYYLNGLISKLQKKKANDDIA